MLETFSRALIVAVALFLASFAGGAILVGQSPPASGGDPEAAKLPNPVPATPESIAAGEQVFQNNCARCHLNNAKGGQPVGSSVSSDLTDEKWDHGGTDGEIFNTIKNGIAPAYMMTPWEGQITDANIWNVIHYLRSLGKGEAKKAEP